MLLSPLEKARFGFIVYSVVPDVAIETMTKKALCSEVAWKYSSIDRFYWKDTDS